MSQIPGTNVSAPIVPQTTDDTFATHDEQYGKGGYGSVALFADLAAIKSGRLKAGMRRKVLGDDGTGVTGRVFELGADLVTWTGLKTDAENAAALATSTAPLLDWATTTPSNTTDGGFMAPGGTVTASPTYRYAILPIAAGTRVRVTSASIASSVNLAVYFDASGAPISAQTLGDGATAYTNFELTVPTAARSIAINGRTTQPIVVQTFVIASSVAPRLTAAEVTLATTVSALALASSAVQEWQSQAVTPVDGAYMTPAGTTISSPTYRYSTLSLAAGTRVRVTSAALVSAVNLATYYDANGAVIGTQSPGDGTLYNNFELTVPAAARKVVINGKTTQPISIQIIGYVANIGSRLTSLETGLAAAVPTLMEWTTQAPAVVDGGFMAPGGTVTSSPTYRYATLPFAAGTRIRVTSAPISNSVYLAVYYDVNNNILSSQTIGDGSTAYTNFELTVPATAQKVVVNGRTTQAIVMQTYIIAANIAPRLTTVEAGSATLAAINSSLQDWVATTAPTVDGSLMGNTGPVTASYTVSYRYATLAVAPGARVRVTSDGISNTVNLAYYYNIAGAVIGSEPVGNNAVYYKHELTVPTGTTSIAVNGRITAPIMLEVIGTAPNVIARIVNLENLVINTGMSIAIFGDSTGASGSGIADNVAAAYPGRTVYKQAIPGQRTPQAATRMGAIPLTLTITGGQIPTSGTVRCVPSLPILSGTGVTVSSLRVMVLGVLCDFVYDSSLDSNAGGHYLAPVSYPPTAVTVPDGTVATILTGWVTGASAAAAIPLGVLLSGIVVVRTGVNDLAGGVDLPSTIVLMNSILTQVRRYSQRALFFGVMPGGTDLPTSQGGSVATDDLSYATLSKEVGFNSAGAGLFAPFWLDPAANHKALGGTEVKTVSGVSFDVMTSTAPTPVTLDGRHEIALGLAQTTTLLVAKITAMGW